MKKSYECWVLCKPGNGHLIKSKNGCIQVHTSELSAKLSVQVACNLGKEVPNIQRATLTWE